MSTSNSDRGMNRRIGRRGLLRGIAIGGAGLAGAALFGCKSGTTGAKEDRSKVTGALPSGVDPGTGKTTGNATANIEKGRPGGTLRMGWYTDETAISNMVG